MTCCLTVLLEQWKTCLGNVTITSNTIATQQGNFALHLTKLILVFRYFEFSFKTIKNLRWCRLYTFHIKKTSFDCKIFASSYSQQLQSRTGFPLLTSVTPSRTVTTQVVLLYRVLLGMARYIEQNLAIWSRLYGVEFFCCSKQVCGVEYFCY